MARVSLQFILMLGYAVSLAFIALLLEWAARYAHRRSLGASTIGFTYHPERDIWRCPQDQYLFPIFSISAKGVLIYRAPAAACNSCRPLALIPIMGARLRGETCMELNTGCNDSIAPCRSHYCYWLS
jgi:hypothetical protein